MRAYLLILSLFLSSLVLGQEQIDYSSMNLKGKVQTIVLHEYQMGNSKEQNRKQTISFNSNGKKIEEVVYLENVVQYKNTCKYIDGKLDSETILNKQLKPNNIKKKHSYDSKRRLKETKILDGNNKLIQSLQYYYADKEIRVKEYTPSSKLNNETVLIYTPRGVLHREIINDSIRIEYEYNSTGERTNRNEYNKDDLYYKVEYEYDKQGNIISETSQYIGGTATVLSYYYQYDKKGNWISLREQMNGTTFAISTRDISYYK